MSEARPDYHNLDEATVSGFGDEWNAFDQSKLSPADFSRWFDAYFGIFPFDTLPPNSEGFDLGCGSGRWATGVANRVGKLHCIDPATKALDVARRNLANSTNVEFHHASATTIPLPDRSQDFGYSLGVLHHIPDPAAALNAAVQKLKPGAPFLAYLYYRFDNRPAWFRAIWQASDTMRRLISRLPFPIRKLTAEAIAATVYWPLARLSYLAERSGYDVSNMPLSAYRHSSFYVMRTDALDRFGTRLEHRFTKAEIDMMMKDAGLRDIIFSDGEPYWVALGYRDGER